MYFIFLPQMIIPNLTVNKIMKKDYNKIILFFENIDILVINRVSKLLFVILLLDKHIVA